MSSRTTSSTWLEVDLPGLRKTLERKGKGWAIFELVQNSWDENPTEVRVTLTRPKKGKSVLSCTDNSAAGYADLSTAHTLFAESYKKVDAEKRGRFNVGEKYVLALCDEATITSTSGQVIFESSGQRKVGTAKTKTGSIFRGVLDMTETDWDAVNDQVSQLIPPIRTFYNGIEIPSRKPIHTFEATLPTEIADENGIARLRQRKTEIRLYKVEPGEKPSIYERGLPVVGIDGNWHIDVQQKIPLSIERDNVTRSYLETIHVVVLNEMSDRISTEDAAETWVRKAAADPRVSDKAVVDVLDKRYGKARVAQDPNDIGSNREAASKNHTVINGGSMNKGEWENAKRAHAIVPAGKLFPTNPNNFPKNKISPNDYDSDQQRFVRLIETISPHLIEHKVTVVIINDKSFRHGGCAQWKADSYEFTINLAHHDCSDQIENYGLLLHELAHHKVQSNDHLLSTFYMTVTDLGAKLAHLALDQPELFEIASEKLAA